MRFGQVFTITKPCLYNYDPLKPHFYIVKLGFTGVYVVFLIYTHNIDCGYSLEPPRRVPTIYVLSRNMKYIKVFLSEIFQFLEVKFSIYLNRFVFVMHFLIHCSIANKIWFNLYVPFKIVTRL